MSHESDYERHQRSSGFVGAVHAKFIITGDGNFKALMKIMNIY
jgi:hypothetical protein